MLINGCYSTLIINQTNFAPKIFFLKHKNQNTRFKEKINNLGFSYCTSCSSPTSSSAAVVANTIILHLQDVYGLEKLATKLCRLCTKDFGIECKTGRSHNICGILGTWKGGKGKERDAFCRKGMISLNFREMGFKLDLLTSLMNIYKGFKEGSF